MALKVKGTMLESVHHEQSPTHKVGYFQYDVIMALKGTMVESVHHEQSPTHKVEDIFSMMQ